MIRTIVDAITKISFKIFRGKELIEGKNILKRNNNAIKTEKA